jgi:hypothetical protein
MAKHTQLDRQKLKSAILRIVSRCNADELGGVKLHKALYYADMVAFAATGSPITGAEYRKRPFGPTCDAALKAVRELEQAGALTVRDVEYYGYNKKEFHLAKEPDFQGLSEDELALLDEMTSFVCRDHTARAISEISHDVSWQMTEMGKIIPYYLSFNLVPAIVSDETVAWAESAADEIERTRPQQDPVEFEEFRAFRERISQVWG